MKGGTGFNFIDAMMNQINFNFGHNKIAIKTQV